MESGVVFELPGYDYLLIMLSYAQLLVLCLKIGVLWASWSFLSEAAKFLRWWRTGKKHRA